MNIRWSTSSFCHSHIREIIYTFLEDARPIKQVDRQSLKRKHSLEFSVVVAEMLAADLSNRTLACFWAWSQQLG